MTRSALRLRRLRSAIPWILAAFTMASATPVFAAECLEFEFFFRRAALFPNPFNNTVHDPIQAQVTLLVIDEDLNMHLARVKRDRIYNIGGEEVVTEKQYGTFESRSKIVLPDFWDGRDGHGDLVATGNYTMRLKAESSLCGSLSHTVFSTVAR